MRNALIALALLAAGPVTAQDWKTEGLVLQDGTPLRPDDDRRLGLLNDSLGAGLREAFAGGTKADVNQIVAALSEPAMDAEATLEGIGGEWSCQMIKLGKISPIIVYPPFRCRADGTNFEKLTGSQRTKGVLHRDGDRLVYLGSGFVAGDSPVAYADLPERADPQAVPQIMPEVGIVELTGPDQGRILFPYPYLESRMNVLVLSR